MSAIKIDASKRETALKKRMKEKVVKLNNFMSEYLFS